MHDLVENARIGAVAAQPPTASDQPGDSGVWVFIFADMCGFAMFFLLFCAGRVEQPALYEAGRAALDLRLGLANTLILLTSGAFMARAVRQGRAQDWAAVRTSLWLTLGVGALFAISKGVEWGTKISHGIGLTTSEFWTYYFVFTGVHFLHFVIGVVVLLVLLGRCNKPLPQPEKLRWLESGGAYWHMVDLLWIILFAMLYLMRAA